MVDSTEETGLGQAIGRAEAARGVKNDSVGLHVPVLPSRKEKSKLRAWVGRQKIGLKIWLYMIEGLRFVLFYLAFAFMLSYFLYYHQWQEVVNIGIVYIWLILPYVLKSPKGKAEVVCE
jgi:uncharacterized membrane protein